MGRLAGFKTREVVRRLQLLGFKLDRQAGGSHEIWRHPTGRMFVLVRHPKDYPEGLLRASLSKAGISVNDFLITK
jgi:predicted RNA binding protein YcfA (HicA-like mRNA interferase family)